MGHRLSKIYTRTGDDGSTGLAGAVRLAKDDARVEAIGAVDELNSAIGVLLAETLPQEARDLLLRVQHRLFDLGGELAMPEFQTLDDAETARLEAAIDAWNDSLAPLKEFILPGGSRAGAACHLARAVCRRAERALVHLHRAEALRPAMLRYANRLSDLLFVLARVINREAGMEVTYWRKAD